jgi:hypothetical protein
MTFILAACGTIQVAVETPSASPKATAVASSQVAASPVPPATGTSPARASATPNSTSEPTSIPSTTPASTGTSTPGGGSGVLPDYSADTYLDDRSTPTGLVLSYYNAINRHEYLRAYSYWQDKSQLPSYDQFAQGYQDTASVRVSLGTMSISVGAGQTYYTVPLLLKSVTTAGDQQTYSGCFTMHLGLPSAQATPPYQGLGFQTADVQPAASGVNDSDLLAHACDATNQQHGTELLQQNPFTNTSDISASNYLDDRSDAVLVLRSLFNAINSHEYLRAYSYWQDTTQLPSFDQFQKGYENTASVDLTTGTVTPDAGAGQIYYSVPVVLKSKTTAGEQQTFSGCYTLHLAQPAIQATPPFEPLGIRSGNLSQAANNANTADLLVNACTQTGMANPQPTRLVMDSGATKVGVDGGLSQNERANYLVRAASGQYMLAALTSGSQNLYLQVLAPDGSSLLSASQQQTSWQGTLPVTGDYLVSAVASGVGGDFSLSVTIPERVTFQQGAVTASLRGKVGAKETNTYLLRALKGQNMTVTVNAPANDIYLTIYGLDDGQPYVRSVMGQTKFSFDLPTTQDYVIQLVSTHASSENYSVEFIVN